ncbi:unnamed protein product [Polarella glacialis]|uniref:Flavin-containing monooxygenase n=1 Tax=Polarella glacialis TaxID=89957 RepID=A0A813EY66_POLGL|nr:unnamed protein product [Polarella glacialis]
MCPTAGSSVAILGAGPSGLAACKAALEEGLRPSVFEQAAGVGGLWRGDSFGKVWKSLRTNLSKFTCSFSDFPWPEQAPDFPGSGEVQAYLEKYARQHDLLRYMRFQARVISVEPVEGGAGGWNVTWQEGASETKTERFDFVVVATGIFSEPCLDAVPGLGAFTGQVIHAASYREPSQFAGQRVLVVGAAFSGTDVAADLVGAAATVTVASRRPLWYIPRYISGRPADLVFYSRAKWEKGRHSTEEEANLLRHKFFLSIAGDLPEPLQTPNPDRGDLPFVAISDAFLDAARKKLVKVRPSEVVGFDGAAAIFACGSREEFDAVIVATGYRLSLPFFSSSTLQTMEFDSTDLLQPAILHSCILHPGLPGLAFVGIYRGPYFATMELQARYALGLFSGRLQQPTPEVFSAGLAEERQIRAKRPRPQFPHGDYVGMTDSLAKLVGVHPGEILANEAHPLHAKLCDGPLLPFHYRLVGFQSKAADAEAAIEECSKKYPLMSPL